MSDTAIVPANNVFTGRTQDGWRQTDPVRWSAVIGGSAVALLGLAYGLSKRSKAGVALAAGGGLLAALGARTGQSAFVANSSVLVNCAQEEAYRFWRDLENLPRFMRHLESVTVLSNDRSRWTAIGPLGKKVEWDAEIVTDRPNEAIVWRSLPESPILVDGTVRFSRAPGNRGTLITATVVYAPPAGQAGNVIARLLGKEPAFLMRQDLRRLKALIEAGEIPTTEGQSHGPRSGVTAVARVLDPDAAIQGEASVAELLTGKRRVS